MIKILVYQEGKPINEFSQSDGRREITIGRAPGCLIRLDESSISRLHALIKQNEGNWIIERRANFGAVKVNGQEIENAVLQGGEEVQIGNFSLRIVLEEPESVARQSTGSFNMEEGRTRVLGGAVAHGFFRFEPGTANVAEFVLQQETGVFGRASNCDVVLLDKKASRKHIEVRRSGLSFYLKDLDSANGTLVNERKITGEVELVPGDVIQVGNSKFQFSIENKEFFAKQGEFLPVPSSLIPSPDMPAEVPPNENLPTDYVPQEENASPAMDSFGAAPEEEKSLFKKLWKNYQSLPSVQRIGIILVVLLVGSYFLQDNEPPKKKENTVATAVVRDKDGKIIRGFAQLSKDKQVLVRDAYVELIEAHAKKDYQKMQDIVTKIKQHVDDYKDLLSYEKIAIRGIEDEKAKELKRAEDERRAALAKEISAMEEKGKILFAKALNSPEARPELTAFIQELYAKDPNSQIAQEWNEAIKQKDAQDERNREIERKKAQLKEKAEAEFAAVELIFKQERYKEALAASEKLNEVGYSENGYNDRIVDLQRQIREKLSSVIDPLLKEAEAQRANGGDLVKANQLYLQVIRIDSQNAAAIKGLESIRDTLHGRARRFYSLAVLAESISDLAEAKSNFAKCLHTAPEDDIYSDRCKSKLLRYEVYQGHDGN